MESMNVLTSQLYPQLQSLETDCSPERRMNELGAHTRSIPTEIMEEIFLHLTIPFQDCRPGDNTSIPLKLGAVCQSWRSTAWGCPRLWSSITLNFSDRPESLGKILLLQDWLSRSGKLPLSIRLHCHPSAESWSHDICQTVYRTLNLHAPRWYEIDFRIPSSSFEYLSSDTTLPLLRYFSIALTAGGSYYHRRIQLGHTPQLRRLSINCGALYLRSYSFEWHQLTDLEVFGVAVDECMELLAHTPNLINFALHQLYGGGDYHLPPIELSSLESILFDPSSGIDLTRFFKNVITPKAKKFKYLGLAEDDNFPAIEFGAFLNRSGCSLTELSLVDILVTEGDLFAIFPSTPSLQSLTFISYDMQEEPSFTDNIWSSLNPSITSSPHLLPQLERLTYDGPLHFTWEVILKTIESRYMGSIQGPDPTPGFNSVSFCIRGPASTLDPDIKLGFERFKASGLHLEIRAKELLSRPPIRQSIGYDDVPSTGISLI